MLKEEVLKSYVREMVTRRKSQHLGFPNHGDIRVGIAVAESNVVDTGETVRTFIPLNLISDINFDWFDAVYGDRLRGGAEFIFSAAVGSSRRGPAK